MNQNSRGFTIVELLIVIIVIAILTAVGIVAYSGVQSRAHDAAIKGDFRKIMTKLQIYKVETGSYPHDINGNASGGCSTVSPEIKSILSTIDIKLSTGSYDTSIANTNLLYIASNDGEHFALLAYALGNPTYYISDRQTAAAIYDDDGTSQTRYPGGTSCGIADNIGVSSHSTNEDFGFYYVYIRNNGGFRIWG